ncbi:hypothetical protein [Massilia sp. UBA6681]|uniref:hypothetical protein n=1 Tax=Massilia sp. UBA6681 TaxID=1946839 RepID=UPI0025C1856F|nr:hypothetical protein [Massilia sp. UBA6681]
MTGHPSPSTLETLHIVCPPSRKPPMIAVSCAGLAVLAFIAIELFNGPPERFSWFKVWVLVLMATFLYAILHRNLFVRDELLVYRDKAEAWALEDEDVLALVAGSVLAVRIAPMPALGSFSAEAQNIAMGIGNGLIEIETLDGSYRFGAGLDEDIARVTARQIAAYCGLQESGPMWKAATAQT